MRAVPLSLEEDAEFSCVLTGCRDSWPSRWARSAGRWEGKSWCWEEEGGAWSRHHLHTGAPSDRVLLNGVEAQDYSQNPGAQG